MQVERKKVCERECVCVQESERERARLSFSLLVSMIVL